MPYPLGQRPLRRYRSQQRRPAEALLRTRPGTRWTARLAAESGIRIPTAPVRIAIGGPRRANVPAAAVAQKNPEVPSGPRSYPHPAKPVGVAGTEIRPGVEPGYTVLQTAGYPLTQRIKGLA